MGLLGRRAAYLMQNQELSFHTELHGGESRLLYFDGFSPQFLSLYLSFGKVSDYKFFCRTVLR